MTAFTGGDLDTAAAAGRRALDIGSTSGISDLQAMGLHLDGRALVAKGRVEEGMALLDEATAAAVSGELSPQVTGRVYCSTVSACWGLGDYRRAGEWAPVEVVSIKWALPQPRGPSSHQMTAAHLLFCAVQSGLGRSGWAGMLVSAVWLGAVEPGGMTERMTVSPQDRLVAEQPDSRVAVGATCAVADR